MLTQIYVAIWPQWVNWTLKNKHQWNFDWKSNIFIEEICLKMSSAKCRPFCLGLTMLRNFRIHPSAVHPDHCAHRSHFHRVQLHSRDKIDWTEQSQKLSSPGRAPPWTETGGGTPSRPSTGRSSSHVTRFQHLGHVTMQHRSSHQLTKAIGWSPKASAFHFFAVSNV